MREILFRGKRIDNDEWVEGSLVTRRYNDTGEVFETFIVVDAYPQTGVMNFGTTPVLISPSDGLCFRVDKDTICQYTGLTDKNGNKIWENDIVKVGVDKALAMYSEKRSGYILQPIGDYYFDSPMLVDNVDIIDNIIGNIFDNADLVKE